MKNILTRNAQAIFDIAMNEGVDVGVARDMFASNLQLFNTEGVIHKGAKVNYSALAAEWGKMTKDEQAEAKTAFSDMMRDKYHDLGNAYAAGDWDTFNAIVDKWK